MSVTLSAQYTGTGLLDTYAIPFDYDTQDQVVVTLSAGGPAVYTFPDAGHIKLSANLANGVVLTIARSTNIDTAKEVFQAGSAIPKSKLNRALRQILFGLQEVAYTINNTIIAGGNVPTPGGGNVGKWLKATAAGAWAWVSITLADISDASANGRSLVGAANYAAMKTLLGLDQVNNTSDNAKLQATPYAFFHRNGAGATLTSPINTWIKCNFTTISINNPASTFSISGGSLKPSVAGTYLVFATAFYTAVVFSNAAYVGIGKNGTIVNYTTYVNTAASGNNSQSLVTVGVITCNGTTDVIDFMIQGTNASNSMSDNNAGTSLQAVRIY